MEEGEDGERLMEGRRGWKEIDGRRRGWREIDGRRGGWRD